MTKTYHPRWFGLILKSNSRNSLPIDNSLEASNVRKISKDKSKRDAKNKTRLLSFLFYAKLKVNMLLDKKANKKKKNKYACWHKGGI